jgi:hypothetical protein
MPGCGQSAAVVASGLGGLADLEGCFRLLVHRRNDGIAADRKFDRWPECLTKTGPGSCRPRNSPRLTMSPSRMARDPGRHGRSLIPFRGHCSSPASFRSAWRARVCSLHWWPRPTCHPARDVCAQRLVRSPVYLARDVAEICLSPGRAASGLHRPVGDQRSQRHVCRAVNGDSS